MALLIAAVVGLGLAKAESLTFSCRAEPLAQAAIDLKKVGFNLDVVGPVGKTIVIIDMKSANPGDFVRRLAYAVDATAVSVTGGCRIVRDERAEQARNARYLEAKAEPIRRALRALGQEIDKAPSFSAVLLASRLREFATLKEKGIAKIDPSTLEALNPGRRSFLRLISSLSPESLARIEPGGAMTFSNEPKKYQEVLGGAAASSLAEMAGEQNAWSQTAAADTGLREAADKLGVDIDPVSGDGWRLVLRAEARSGSDLRQFSLSLASGDRDLHIGFYSLSPVGETPSAQAAADGSAIDFEADSLRYGRALSTALRTQSALADPQAREWLLHPDLRDPLSFGVTDALLGIARQSHENLVAVPGDDTYWLTTTFFDRQGNFHSPSAAFLRQKVKSENAFIEEHDGWMTIRPRMDSPDTDREALARLLESENADGCLRLEPLSAFAVSDLRLTELPIVAKWSTNALTPHAEEGADIRSWAAFRTWGLLPDEAKRDLRANQRVSVAALTDAAKAELVRDLFFTADAVLYGLAKPSHDPSEALPNGLPPDSSVALSQRQSMGIFAEMEGQFGSRLLGLNAESFAAIQLARTDPKFAGFNPSHIQEVTRARFGQINLLRLDWAVGGMFVQSLTDGDVDLRKAPIPYRDAPEKFKARVAEVTPRLRDLFSRGIQPIPETAPPPP